MPRRYNRLKSKAASERGKRMAVSRWAKDRARRDAEMPERIRELAEIEIQNMPHRPVGAVGCLQYHDFATGKVARWTVEIGDRSDRRVLRSPDGRRSRSSGWSFLLRCVRMVILGHYSALKRQPSP
jgi:hypothetical protein